jgi:acyl carrier protein
MTDAVSLHDRISELFAASLNVVIPSVETDLFESGALDSLAFVELLLHLEREFGITTSVDDLEIENFRSIARIADFVAGRAASASAASYQPRIVKFGTGR